MRHLKAGKKLNRTSSHRQAMFANMCTALFDHELIKTTLAKAKEIRRVAEPLITRAKSDSVHNRRLVFAFLRDKAAVGKLFTVLGPRYHTRPGGYLRIIKCGFRPGDNAPMAYVELVDRGLEPKEVKPSKKKATKTKGASEAAAGEAVVKQAKAESQAPSDTKKQAKAKQPKADAGKAKDETTKAKPPMAEPVEDKSAAKVTSGKVAKKSSASKDKKSSAEKSSAEKSAAEKKDKSPDK